MHKKLVKAAEEFFKKLIEIGFVSFVLGFDLKNFFV